ncbi:MAG: PorT family protein [Prevotella sp.]|jgi:hypothetical protein|nr:PorT family protein [Prevotella sp.]
MKTIIKTSLIAIALLMGVNASAQTPITFGIKAGVNLSNLTGDSDGTKAKIGFNAGVTVDFGIAQDVYLLTGLEYSLKGAKLSDEGETMKLGLSYIQLPIHVGYKLAVAEGTNIVFHAGPYLGYLAGGNWSYDGASIGIFSDAGEAISKFKRFDFGVGLGVGAEFGKIGVGLGWDFGLAKIMDEANVSVKNSNAYLTVGYKF